MNPFQNFKANAEVTLPNYQELVGVHKIKVLKVVVGYDTDNVEGNFEESNRDWLGKNPTVYLLIGNDQGVFHLRHYFYAYLKWDELKASPIWNQYLDNFKISGIQSTKPWAIYTGPNPVKFELLPNEEYIMNQWERVPSPIGTEYSRKLYSITCKALGVPGCDNPDQLLGKEAWVDIRPTYFAGKKRMRLHQISDQPIGAIPVAPIYFPAPKAGPGANLEERAQFDI